MLSLMQDYRFMGEPLRTEEYRNLTTIAPVCGRDSRVSIEKAGYNETYELTASGLVGRTERIWALSSFAKYHQNSGQ